MQTTRWLALGLILSMTGLGCQPDVAEPEQPTAPEETEAGVVEQPQEPELTEPAEEPVVEPVVAEELVTPEIVRDAPVQLVAEEGAGKLYMVGDLPVCVMEGTHEEMGYQHGRLLAERIRHTIHEGYMKRSLFDEGYTVEYANEQSARMAKHFPPQYIEEMNGLVRGLTDAGIDVSYEQALVSACMAELLHHGPDAPPGCSNFAVFGRWTSDGRLLHGRNLDWDVEHGAQDGAVVMVWRPTGGTPFMMPGWAGTIGSVSGMNAAGITIGEMTSSSPDETFDGIPLLIIMRRVLEEAKTVEEAVSIIAHGPRTLGWNFVIGDGARRDARALEVDAKFCGVYAPEDPMENEGTAHWSIPDAVRRTNHPCGDSQLAKVARQYGEQNGIDLSDWDTVKPMALGLLKDQNSWHRYDWLGKQIQARPGAVGVIEALQLLSNGPVRNDVTLHSWVFDPDNQLAYVANAGVDPIVTATSMPFTEVKLAQWFK